MNDMESTSTGAEEAASPGLESEELREASRRLGYSEVPEIVAAVATPLARGHHLAIAAGEGSGKEILFGLAATLRSDAEAPGPQTLILSATPESARRIARAAETVAGPHGLRTVALSGEHGASAPAVEKAARNAHVLVGTPDSILTCMRRGDIKLGLRLLVLDAVHAYESVEAWPAVEAIVDTLESDTQRIACSAQPDALFDDLLERRLPRARKWPAELFPLAGVDAPVKPERPGRISVGSARTEAERVDRVAGVLAELAEHSGWDHASVYCRDGHVGQRIAAELATLGLGPSETGDAPGVTVEWTRSPTKAPDVAVLLDLPPDLESMRAWLEGVPVRLAVVQAGHEEHLKILARRLGWKCTDLPEPVPAEAKREIEKFRHRVRERAESVDTSAQLLVLDPLLEEMGGAGLAAVLSAMLRERDTEGDGPQPGPEAAVRPTWTRIFINVGKRDGTGPGDIVGAITGETGAAAGQIGKIEIRGSHTLVDVDSLVADQVVAGLQGKRIKSRDIVARPDRTT